MRIALNANALVIKGITTNDVANALRAANVTSPQGTLSNGVSQMTVTANDALHTPRGFRRAGDRQPNGVPVRLADVATISSGQQDQYAAAWFNGTARGDHADQQAAGGQCGGHGAGDPRGAAESARGCCRPTCRSPRSST